MKKVLVIRLGAIGDVVETSGLIQALKKENWTIDYLTGNIPAELICHNPDINKTIIFQSKKYPYIVKLGLELRKEKYDLVINLQPSLRMKTLVFLANPKKRVNYKKSYKFHAVENFFETGKRVIPTLNLEKNIKLFIPDNIKQKMKNQLTKDKIKICFNTGANSSRQGRKWCIDYWIELASLILNKYKNAEIILIGSKEDESNVKNLIDKFPAIKNFVGKTTLIETAGLLSECDLLISGDTGPLHIASATGVTCLGLYGCCSVSRSGPYGEKHHTIISTKNCAPCDKRRCDYIKSDFDDTPCMREIKPEKVINLVDMIINKS